MPIKINDLTTLVVEDERFMRMLIIHALESMGFASVLEAESGEQALQVMAKHHIDFIITDIEMTVPNGLELVRQIRAGKTRADPGTRVIFLTGLRSASILAAAAELDVQGYLSKPFSAKQLREKIEQAYSCKVRLRDPSAYDASALSQDQATGWAEDALKTENTPLPSASRELGAEEGGGSEPEKSVDRSDTRAPRAGVTIENLHPGMILCEDICAKGVLMLRKGVQLDHRLLLVLRDMRSVLDKTEFEVEVPED